MIKKLLNRRTLGLVAVLLSTQMLSGCIVLPVGGGYYRHGPYYHDRGWR